MSKVITAEDVRSLVASHWEDDTPDKILAVFQANEGKRWSKRILAKLPGGEAEWSIRQVAGMTNIVDRDYYRYEGRQGYSFLVHYDSDEGREYISAQRLQDRNTCYFSARRERNALRLEAKNAAVLCARVAITLNAVASARRALAAAEKAFDELTGYGEPFSPDRHALLALISDEE
jgi:hypothetical protein